MMINGTSWKTLPYRFVSKETGDEVASTEAAEFLRWLGAVSERLSPGQT